MNPLAGKSLVVLNTSADTIELLKSWFEAEGMIVRTATVSEFRTGEGDIAAFLAMAAPDVIIYDVALPYVANWQFLQKLRTDGPFKDVPLIVTTPNAHVLRTVTNLSNAEATHEIVGKPADMQQLTAMVRDRIGLGV
jgi:CheY-like chemotaxis protein